MRLIYLVLALALTACSEEKQPEVEEVHPVYTREHTRLDREGLPVFPEDTPQ